MTELPLLVTAQAIEKGMDFPYQIHLMPCLIVQSTPGRLTIWTDRMTFEYPIPEGTKVHVDVRAAGEH